MHERLEGLRLTRLGPPQDAGLWTVSLPLPQGAPAGLGMGGRPTYTSGLGFSPEGKGFAAGGARVQVVEVADWRHVLELDTPGVFSVAFSPDSSLLAAGCADNTVLVWDAAAGELRATLRGHSDQVRSIAFSPDGSLLASGSEDHTVRLWDVSGFKQDHGETPRRGD